MSRIFNSDIDVAPPNIPKDNCHWMRLIWNCGVLYINNRLIGNSRTAYYASNHIGYQASALDFDLKQFYIDWFCKLSNKENLIGTETIDSPQWNGQFFNRNDVKNLSVLNPNAFKPGVNDDFKITDESYVDYVESRRHNIEQVLRNIRNKNPNNFTNNHYIAQLGYNQGADTFHRTQYPVKYTFIVDPAISKIMSSISYSDIVWKFEHPQNPKCIHSNTINITDNTCTPGSEVDQKIQNNHNV